MLQPDDDVGIDPELLLDPSQQQQSDVDNDTDDSDVYEIEKILKHRDRKVGVS